MAAFNRLSVREDWDKEERKEEKLQFSETVMEAAEQQLASDKLSTLHAIIERYMPERKLPKSVTQCRRLITTLYVNIYDFANPDPASASYDRQFDSLGELRRYTKKRGKVFPKDVAKENLATKLLLRPIF